MASCCCCPARELAGRPSGEVRHERKETRYPVQIGLGACVRGATEHSQPHVLLDRELGEDMATFRNERDAAPGHGIGRFADD